MKRIIIFLICFLVSIGGYSQFVNTTQQGSATTLINSKGGSSADSAWITKPSFPDTTTANFSVASKYLGSEIRVGLTFWKRVSSINGTVPNQWLQVNTSAASLVSISQGIGIINTPNPLVTTGTIKADTLALSTRAWRQKGIDSVLGVISNGYIPYIGATNDVNLGNHTLTVSSNGDQDIILNTDGVVYGSSFEMGHIVTKGVDNYSGILYNFAPNGYGLRVNAGSNKKYHTLFLEGYQGELGNDSIANFNPIDINFYKPVNITSAINATTISTTGLDVYTTNLGSTFTIRTKIDKGYADSSNNLRVKYTDTSAMLSGYSRTGNIPGAFLWRDSLSGGVHYFVPASPYGGATVKTTGTLIANGYTINGPSQQFTGVGGVAQWYNGVAGGAVINLMVDGSDDKTKTYNLYLYGRTAGNFNSTEVAHIDQSGNARFEGTVNAGSLSTGLPTDSLVTTHNTLLGKIASSQITSIGTLANLTVTGTVNAGTFSGSGANLTGVIKPADTTNAFNNRFVYKAKEDTISATKNLAYGIVDLRLLGNTTGQNTDIALLNDTYVTDALLFRTNVGQTSAGHNTGQFVWRNLNPLGTTWHEFRADDGKRYAEVGLSNVRASSVGWNHVFSIGTFNESVDSLAAVINIAQEGKNVWSAFRIDSTSIIIGSISSLNSVAQNPMAFGKIDPVSKTFVLGTDTTRRNNTDKLQVTGNAYISGLLTVSDVAASGNITATNVSGTLTTASQPNITTVGTLIALTVAQSTSSNRYVNNGVGSFATLSSGKLQMFSTASLGMVLSGFGTSRDVSILDNTGNLIMGNTAGTTTVTMGSLAGTGSRAVLADANGVLSAPVSDSSLKRNIRPIGYGLKEVLKMKPVWFEFKKKYQNYGSGRQNGNIAQDMEKVIPEVVITDEKTGIKGINYGTGQLDAVYIKAIQELNEKFEKYKKETDKKIASLENRLKNKK